MLFGDTGGGSSWGFGAFRLLGESELPFGKLIVVYNESLFYINWLINELFGAGSLFGSGLLFGDTRGGGSSWGYGAFRLLGESELAFGELIVVYNESFFYINWLVKEATPTG